MSEQDPYPYERKLPRHKVSSCTVEIFDTMREVCLGRLVNIHKAGLMLMGDVKMESDSIYQLELHLPEPINGRQVIHLGVDCLWARESEDQTKQWAGFSIIDIAPDAQEDIDKLINLMGE